MRHYLGDGLYARFTTDGLIELSATNNKVFLDQGVYRELRKVAQTNGFEPGASAGRQADSPEHAEKTP